MGLKVDVQYLMKRRRKIEFSFKFEVERGQAVGISGPTGAGKSTLFRLLAGLDSPDSGYIVNNGTTYFENGNSLPVQKRNVAFVFQEGGLFPHLSVLRNLMLSGCEKSKAEQALQSLSLGSLADSMPWEISGGQYQLVSGLRAQLQKADLLLLDEPFSSLDEQTKEFAINSWTNYFDQNPTTALVISHDLSDLRRLCNGIITIENGVNTPGLEKVQTKTFDLV